MAKKKISKKVAKKTAGKAVTKKVMPTKFSARAEQPASRRINVQNRIRSTVTGTRLFDRTLHKTNAMLRMLMEEMNWDNRERALSAFRATLHALRDVLPFYEVLDMGAQLPLLVRGLYYENWHYDPEPLRLRSSGEFYELVRDHLGRGGNFTTDEIRESARCVLSILAHQISPGEMRDVRGALTKRLQPLIDGAEDGRERPVTRRSRRALSHARASRRDRRVARRNAEHWR